MTDSANDLSQLLQEQVLSAISNKTALQIVGGNSKAFYGRPTQGNPLSVNGHQGIINYEPTELVITARCGTKLADIENTLTQQRQMLAFEPPYFTGNATLGGAAATGLSGPRRPYAGSVRDTVLGITVLNGHGEILKFGGQVMKNVAGFDISRLMVGALGTLGVLLNISVKVLPMPETETTVALTMNLTDAINTMNHLAGQNLPISAMCYDDVYLRIRLSGAESAITRTAQLIGGELMTNDAAIAFWADLREQQLAFFQDDRPLWRLSLAPAAVQPDLSGTWLIDWGGALRWLKTNEPDDSIFQHVSASGGHACRFRSSLGSSFQPLTPGLEQIHHRIKNAFDPYGIFNPGRLYQSI